MRRLESGYDVDRVTVNSTGGKNVNDDDPGAPLL